MTALLSKLNRLRVNAGKTELKSWKASTDKLLGAISTLEEAGFTDVLEGANVEADPVSTDPEVAKNHPPKLGDSDFMKATANPPKPEVREKGRATLARGLDTEPYARHCRQRVKDQRDAERAKKKAESKPVTPVGKVDAKKHPEKAKRQENHVKAKREARAAKPVKEKDGNVITVAELARELNIDPKVARAKMRRYEGKPTYPKTIAGERWSFPIAAASELRVILTGVK